jgi:squalene-hopene/tetraprenyl-beta-curcumene cyclase
MAAIGLSAFPPGLRQEIGKIANHIKELEQGWSDKIRFADPKARLSIYACFPNYFLAAFPQLSHQDVRPLAAAGWFLANTLFLFDKLMDSPSDATVADLLRAQAMQMETNHLLHKLFSPPSIFWTYHQSYAAQYAEACLQENAFASGDRSWSEYSESKALQIIIGKSGFLRSAVAGLSELAGDYEHFIVLTEAVNQYNIAGQMLDDLVDWKEDIHRGCPSLLLKRVLDERPSTLAISESQIKEIAGVIYYEGHAYCVLEKALQALDKADGLVCSLPDLLWLQVTAGLRGQCQALLNDIEQIVNNNRKRIETLPKLNLLLPTINNPWQQVMGDGLQYLVREWRLGFGEARHIMVFSHDQGFTGTREYQYGDVFQRALIADTFCDGNETLRGQLESVINYEADYLISKRRSTGIGGWSYFPELPELPPDADDLAQIMQVLLRSGRRLDVEKYCEPPLQSLLKDHSHEDGSFETWIIPATERTPEQERQAKFARLAWGMGADPEVVANLLFAMMLYDPGRFQEIIEKGSVYLRNQQQDNGSWESSWYHGPYYGVYVCLRLLTRVNVVLPTVQRAYDFLQNSQHSDGSWGTNGDSGDPLSTALSLLALAEMQMNMSLYGSCSRELAGKALVYLQECQDHTNQSWADSQLIRMIMGRADGEVRRVLSYGSRTITTSFVTKAATIWHQLML